MNFISGMVSAMLQPRNNEIMRGKGFYISFNPAPAWGGEAGAETALVNTPKKGRGVFLILNGDFRSEYKKLIPKGYKACKAFYNKKKGALRSDWSED